MPESINSDGKTLGLASPSASSQEACIREAYARAGIANINETGFFECHGTGTVAGDPAEAMSVGKVFGRGLKKDEPLYIGSIKTNVGHGEGASALNGIIKGVLALEAGQVPPNIHFEQPNPKIHFEAWKLKVPTEVLPWPKNKAKRVSVASYGYGGANAHVILESLDHYLSTRSHLIPSTDVISHTKQFIVPFSEPSKPTAVPTAMNNGCSRPFLSGFERPFLLTFSAKSEASVKQYIKSLADMVAGGPAQGQLANKVLLDLAYTLGTRRSVLPVKAYGVISPIARNGISGDGGPVVVEDAAAPFTIAELGAQLTSLSENVQIFPEPYEPTRIGFIFTGQGAQWAQMGTALIEVFPSVGQTLAKLDSALAELPDAPLWGIESELRRPREKSQVNEPQFSQVLCTAVQIALVDLLRRWNVVPRGVVGHSSGEIAAAYASGALRAEEAIIVAFYRGKVCGAAAAGAIPGLINDSQKNGASDDKPRDGGPAGAMLAVGLGRDEVELYMAPLKEKLVIACVNSPKNVTISGDRDAIEQLEKSIAGPASANGKDPIFTRRLKVPLAYHSHHMTSLGGDYQQLLEQPQLKVPITPKVGMCPMFSTVTGKLLDGRKVTPEYWRQNLESPVEFAAAVQLLVEDACVNTLIEIGPHSAMSGPVREIRGEMGLKPRELSYIPTLIRGNNCVLSILEFVGALFSQGYTDVALEKVNMIEEVDLATGEVVLVERGSVIVDAPFYAWDHSREYWFESRRSREWRFRKHPRHDLLGSKVTGTDLAEWQWMNHLGPNNTKWLKDHKVRGNCVMPAVGYVSMAIEAFTQMLETADIYDPNNAFYMREISIQKPFTISDDREAEMHGRATEIYTTLHQTQGNLMDVSKWYQFTIRSTGEDGIPVKHCTGYICSDKRRTTKKMPGTEGKRLREVSGDKLYKAMKSAGFDHGPWFRGLEQLRVVTNGGREIYAKMANFSRPEAWERMLGEKKWATAEKGLEKEKEKEPGLNLENKDQSAGVDSEVDAAESRSNESPATVSPSAPSSEPSTSSSLSSAPIDGTPYASGKLDGGTAEAELIQSAEASAFNAPDTPIPVLNKYTTLTLGTNKHHVESRYAVHPINLDIPVQLVFVTVFSGKLSAMSDIFVPVFVDEMYVASPSPDASQEFDMHCSVKFTSHFIFPQSDCHAWDSTGQEIFHLSNLQGMEIGSTLQGHKASKPPDNFRLEWVVDFDFVRQGNFGGVLELNVPEPLRVNHDSEKDLFARHYFLTLLAADILQITDGIELPEQSAPHFHSYRRWLEHLLSDEGGMREHRMALCGGKDVDVKQLSTSERQQEIERLASSIIERVEGKLAHTIFKNILPLIRGEREPIELLSTDGMLDDLHADEHGVRMSNYQTAMARLYSRKYARANVLQIGGIGLGGMQAILNGMTRDGGGAVMERCYGSFTYTDRDADSIKKAREKLDSYSGVEFSALDLQKDLGEQGFGEMKYEIIYASNALHTYEDIPTVLHNIAKLLTPEGKLVITETLGGHTTGHFDFPFIMGVMPAWWLVDRGDESVRLGPLLSKEQWLTIFEKSEFQLDLQQDDRAELKGNTMLVLTRKAVESKSTEPSSAAAVKKGSTTASEEAPVHPGPAFGDSVLSTEPTLMSPGLSPIILLHRHSVTPTIEAIGAKLTSCCNGREILHKSLSSISEVLLQEGSFFVSLMELDWPLLADITEVEFRNLKLVLATKDSYLLWVTSGVHLAAENPELALVTGFARTLRNELQSFRFNTLDLSTTDTEARAQWVSNLVAMLSSRPADMENLNLEALDWEFCEYGGILYILRLVVDQKTRARYGNQREQHQTKLEPYRQEEKNLGLVVPSRGMLSSLVWKHHELDELEPDHVEVRVVANGLNFKDVATAMGLVPYLHLGTEWAGTVLRVGSAVTKVSPGDRVTGMAPSCFINKLHVWEGSCVKIPDVLKDTTFTEIMACNVVYSTAMRTLMHIGRLKKGETVLIHSAAGGVGLAAIQLCRMIGAEIYATCGTPEKRQVLIQEHGIPDDHIFSSRDTSFREMLMAATKGRGVDVILNSLSGDLLHESLRCLAPFGRFLEIGKRDILLRGRIDLQLLLRNIHFATMDLSELWALRHPDLALLMEEWLELLAAGKISPVRPIKEFSVTDVEQAFRYMSTGTHMGKIVITGSPDPGAGELVKVGQGASPPHFDPGSSYLIVGGLGGIGSSIAVWMAENGARHLCLMTRSGAAIDEASKKALEDLEAMGCRAQIMQCDVGDSDAVEIAIQAAERPIRGVLHAAMSLRDGIFENMTHADFKEPMHAKVRGLMNLHHSFQRANHRLSFFVVLSSFVGIFGNPGQSNYAAAGTFQDAFVRYRHKLGLPATAIDLGVVTGVGYVTRNRDAEKKLVEKGYTLCEEWHVHQLVRMAIDNPVPPAPASATSSTSTSPSLAAVRPQQFTSAQLVAGIFITDVPKMATKFNDPKWSIIYSTGLGINPDSELFGDEAGFPDPMRDIDTRPAEDVINDLCTGIIRKTASLTGVPKEEIKEDHSLKRYGMDSLVAVEMRNWLLKVSTVELAAADIMNAASIRELAEKIYNAYKAKGGKK